MLFGGIFFRLGYLLLGCRARREEDEAVIGDVIRSNFKKIVDPEKLFSISSPYLQLDLSKILQGMWKFFIFLIVLTIYDLGFEHVVWTLEARRLAVLIGQALKYGEPLLLVGETG